MRRHRARPDRAPPLGAIGTELLPGPRTPEIATARTLVSPGPRCALQPRADGFVGSGVLGAGQPRARDAGRLRRLGAAIRDPLAGRLVRDGQGVLAIRAPADGELRYARLQHTRAVPARDD